MRNYGRGGHIMGQVILRHINQMADLYDYKVMLVCGNSFDQLGLELDFDYIRFGEFSPNPTLEQVERGLEVFKENNCDCLFVVGGGSAIDVAKGIKYLNGDPKLLFIALPTTAGSGAESTKNAVIYKNGEKWGLGEEWTLPDVVILQSAVLKTLPHYIRISTYVDAICQAIESWWSNSSTQESIYYSKKALELLVKNKNRYVKNHPSSYEEVLVGSNFAGKAINITRTTLPHAMSYGLVLQGNMTHGHAVGVSLVECWKYMGGYDEIAHSMGFENHNQAIEFLKSLLEEVKDRVPKGLDPKQLADSVNLERLSNMPGNFTYETILGFFKAIVK